MVVKHYRTDHHKKSISISIIGGSDGPTSIFIEGKHWDKISEKVRCVRIDQKWKGKYPSWKGIRTP